MGWAPDTLSDDSELLATIRRILEDGSVPPGCDPSVGVQALVDQAGSGALMFARLLAGVVRRLERSAADLAAWVLLREVGVLAPSIGRLLEVYLQDCVVGWALLAGVADDAERLVVSFESRPATPAASAAAGAT